MQFRLTRELKPTQAQRVPPLLLRLSTLALVLILPNHPMSLELRQAESASAQTPSSLLPMRCAVCLTFWVSLVDRAVIQPLQVHNHLPLVSPRLHPPSRRLILLTPRPLAPSSALADALFSNHPLQSPRYPPASLHHRRLHVNGLGRSLRLCRHSRERVQRLHP